MGLGHPEAMRELRATGYIGDCAEVHPLRGKFTPPHPVRARRFEGTHIAII